MKILVKPAGPDRRVPLPKPPLRDGMPRYFPHGQATAIELDHFIQRRLECGDLVRVEAEPTAPDATLEGVSE